MGGAVVQEAEGRACGSDEGHEPGDDAESGPSRLLGLPGHPGESYSA